MHSNLANVMDVMDFTCSMFNQLLILSDILLQRQKSKKEVMEEIILKSKFFKVGMVNHFIIFAQGGSLTI